MTEIDTNFRRIGGLSYLKLQGLKGNPVVFGGEELPVATPAVIPAPLEVTGIELVTVDEQAQAAGTASPESASDVL